MLEVLFDYLFILEYSKADDNYHGWFAVISLIFNQVNNVTVKLDRSINTSFVFLPAMYRVVSSA